MHIPARRGLRSVNLHVVAVRKVNWRPTNAGASRFSLRGDIVHAFTN
jgi:hypothetical protein